MSRTSQVIGIGAGINGDLNGASAVFGGNARFPSQTRRGINTDRKSGLIAIGIFRDHQG